MDNKQAIALASDIKAQKNLQKKIKIQMKELIDSELITQRGLIKVPLHPFNASMKRGKYFQHPDRDMLLANSRESFGFMELESIRFVKDCNHEGILLP